MIKYKFILLILLAISAFADDGKNLEAYKTLEGYANIEREHKWQSYFFDYSFSAINTINSLYGLARFKKHQDEVSLFCFTNLIASAADFYRLGRDSGGGGPFNREFKKVKAIQEEKGKNKVSEYKLMELSNGARQIRKINGYYSILTGLLVGIFSEGKKGELLISGVYAANGLSHLLINKSFGEDVYDRYFLGTKIVSINSKERYILTLNYQF